MTRTFPGVRRSAAAVTVAVAMAAGAAPLVLSAPAVATPPADAESTAAARIVLPAPTGAFAVGRESLHLVDRSRADPWVPGNRRELMVSMFYPAATEAGPPARYLTTAEAQLFIEDRGVGDFVDAATLSGTRSAARESAPPRRGRYPLVVLSPGFTLHRHTQTHLAEELASRGYVVAAIDHAYESSGTTFPGGRTLGCVACDIAAEADVTVYPQVSAGRGRDASFVLDRLTGARPAWRHAGLIDRTRIGMAGHSIGGNATGSTMIGDQRVRAGINMDGTFFDPIPAAGLNGRAFMMLGTTEHAPGGRDTSWDQAWTNLDGWKRWLSITGTGHLSFCDTPVLAEQAGIPSGITPISADRTVELVRTYVTAFFDKHLRGTDRPVLDAPTAANPEIVFHQP
ncbi:lipase [Actinoplanes sp. NBRC 101535]|uniref:alpha/beta hydrolase family protein n=1 Tax=Actinoplanes sp. NBRC 101535 TaxID=3032196 RepID=UPI00255474F8|nr:lipase [Actinoplanes sp. NBRC 101535]